LQILWAARSKAQQIIRHCAKDYWSELSETIQKTAVTGNIRGMYDGIKTVMGPVQNKTVPLKIHHWGSHHRQGTTDGEICGTLF